jgi:hypothetical protein
MLALGGMHLKHAMQRGICVPTQYLLSDRRKPLKPWIEFLQTFVCAYILDKPKPFITPLGGMNTYVNKIWL